MDEAGVPTARAITCTDLASATHAIQEIGAPVVIKASGLAAGEGVIICESVEEARSAAAVMLKDHVFGAAGDTILIEEFMEGEELSVFVLTDGERTVVLPSAQDHKRLLDRDRGPRELGQLDEDRDQGELASGRRRDEAEPDVPVVARDAERLHVDRETTQSPGPCHGRRR
jgi:D-alanine-D-alanine ligase-like ATP-grasp enzyme